MIDILILTAAAVLLGGLLYFEKRESMRGRVLTKPVLSALFVAVALTGPRAETSYFGLVLAGLSFCMAGDVFLIFPASPKLFLAGLVSFLTGHILYAAAFFLTSRPGMLTRIAGACGLAASGAVFAWLRPTLGDGLAIGRGVDDLRAAIVAARSNREHFFGLVARKRHLGVGPKTLHRGVELNRQRHRFGGVCSDQHLTKFVFASFDAVGDTLQNLDAIGDRRFFPGTFVEGTARSG